MTNQGIDEAARKYSTDSGNHGSARTERAFKAGAAYVMERNKQLEECKHMGMHLRIADGIGGLNRYHLRECEYCGFKDWYVAGPSAERWKCD